MSVIPSIVSSHMPTVSTLAQFAESHIPLPMLTLYATLTVLESAIPPAAGFCAIAWITIYQIMSALNLTKNPPLSPIPFIRGCVSSFIGLYLVTFLVMIPIRTNQITNYLASPEATAAIGNYFTRDSLKRFKKSMLNNEPDSTQKRIEHAPDAANPVEPQIPAASDPHADNKTPDQDHPRLRAILKRLDTLQHPQDTEEPTH